MNSADRRLQRLDEAFERADREALAALKRALPAGRDVAWQHGDHWRHATVIEVLGWRYHHADVRVRSSTTGKEYLVGAQTIMKAIWASTATAETLTEGARDATSPS